MAYNIIFDIDQKIVDSSCVRGYRDQGNWNAAYREIEAGNVKPFTGIVELISEARQYGHQIVFVSTSPEEYCRRVLAKIGLNPDKFCGLVPYNRDLYYETGAASKVGLYRAAIDRFPNQYQPVVIIGDSEKDISDAYGLNISYNLFTIRCLWGVTPDRFVSNFQNRASLPYLIMKSVSQLRNFLYYRWPRKQDENGVTYAFDYYPTHDSRTGENKYHDIFTEYFLRDIKGYNMSVSNMPVYVRKWAVRYLKSYINHIKVEMHITDPGQVGILIVPSSTENRWNSALEEILGKTVEMTGATDCRHLIKRHTGRESAHGTNDRSIEKNVETMRIDNPESLRNISVLVILDDIVTSGNTFRACKIVIERDASGVFSGTLKYAALAKTQKLDLPGRITCVCEPNKAAFENIQYEDRRDTYWGVNRNYEFERFYHTNWGCVQSGIRWGFPDLKGVRYYLPLSFESCNRCIRQAQVVTPIGHVDDTIIVGRAYPIDPDDDDEEE